MRIVECRNQAELDAALKLNQSEIEIRLTGNAEVHASGSATVRASDSATIHAWDSATVHASGSATVRAWDSATVHASGSATVRASGSATVRAWDSATIHAWDSATVHASDSATVHASGSATVRASDSATVRASDSATVRASDSATVRASDSATVHAGKYNAVTIAAKFSGKVKGGVQIRIPSFKTLAQWLGYYGLKAAKGFVTLYKGVDADFQSPHGASYKPGTQPEASDWDGGKNECGGGLHFSPSPLHTLDFNAEAKKFVACKIRIKDIAPIHANAQYPSKLKARCVVECVEVDIDGNPVKG